MYNPVAFKYNEIINYLNKNLGSICLCNLTDAAKEHIISTFNNYNKLIIARDQIRAKQIYNDEMFYIKNNVYYYPEKDLLFGNANAAIRELEKDRQIILQNILREKNVTVITTISSLMEKVISKKQYTNSIFKIKKNTEINFDLFVNKLIEYNYERVAEVNNIGEFSIKGGIIDVYLYSYQNPLRIDFFGDEIACIKYYNLDTKRSTEEIDEIEITAAAQNTLRDGFLFEYFDKNKTIIFIDEEKEIVDKMSLIENMVTENMLSRQKENIVVEELKTVDIFTKEEIKDAINEYKIIKLNTFDNCSDFQLVNNCVTFSINSFSTTFNKQNYDSVVNDLKTYLKKGYTGGIVINSHTKCERLIENFREYGIKAYICQDIDKEIIKNTIGLFFGNIRTGFIYEDEKFFLFSENDLFNINVAKKKTKIKINDNDKYQKIEQLSNLKIGDYVVHESHGVGIYKGTKTLEKEGITTAYIVIEYADGGILYIPCTNLECVMKYKTADLLQPKIDSLSSIEWHQVKAKIKKEIDEIAKDIVELYAKRSKSKGYQFSTDTTWQQEFEETFPYEETVDQIKAIDATKRDMESDKCMDRLICGDVGFGKTEVALRASFKAVQDSKQVCILTPTTILTKQHYETFKNRMSNFPINVDFLSRFKTNKEIHQTLQKLKKGEIDIIIGTHRVLSDDVYFNNLGLLIIDEEQRFGVKAKEKIKNMKNNIDVLALSATPIPRTLQMSLSGIRDLSLLTEAPEGRIPIQTYVLEDNSELIREAINRELLRGGQVFVVNNRIDNIYDVARKIQNLVPNASIAVTHGSLGERELDKIMSSFMDGSINVLIATTIIETGIDIPNANTLIVFDSDRFGISQLYQLRGRIGRSEREAYAFFMYKKNKELSGEQSKRLKAIKEFTSLGSGIKIAMKDLEIRGAGNLLGISQSGHIEKIGYEMYNKLLSKALKYLEIENEKEKKKENFNVNLKVDIDAYIPNYYIESEDERLDIYKQISICEKEEDIKKIVEELNDRFGKMPIELENLLYIAKLKIKCKNCFITDAKIQNNYFEIKFYEEAEINTNNLMNIINDNHLTLHYVNSKQPMLIYKSNKLIREDIKQTLLFLEQIIEKILE